jgi:hypothetical protein
MFEKSTSSWAASLTAVRCGGFGQQLGGSNVKSQSQHFQIAQTHLSPSTLKFRKVTAVQAEMFRQIGLRPAAVLP